MTMTIGRIIHTAQFSGVMGTQVKKRNETPDQQHCIHHKMPFRV